MKNKNKESREARRDRPGRHETAVGRIASYGYSTMVYLGYVSLVGLASVWAYVKWDKNLSDEPISRIPHPDTVNYNLKIPIIYDYVNDREIFPWDIGGDDRVDALGFAGKAFWIAPGYEDKITNGKNATVMTSKMIDAASELRQRHLDLSRMLVERAYELDIESRKVSEMKGGKE
jgi:hypothetical protein